MGQKTRFEDLKLKLYVDDVEYGPFKIVDFRSGSDMRSETTKYMGDVEPYIDATDGGYSMSFTCEEIQGAESPDAAFEAYRAAVNERSGLGNLRAVVSWVTPGTSNRKGHRYGGTGSMNVSQSARDAGAAQWQVELKMSRREAI